MRKQRLPTHAKMAQAFVHAPLFSSCEKNGEKKLDFDFTYPVKSSDSTVAIYRFSGPELLSAVDLRTLQGIVAIATNQLSCNRGATELIREGHPHKAALNLTGDALTHNVVAVRFKLYSFALFLCYTTPSKQTLERLRSSILRLCAVAVLLTKPGFVGGYSLASYKLDSVTDTISVCLNPGLTDAVLSKNEFLRLDFGEVRQLKSDPARLLHARLHWINPGLRRAVNIETLSGYIYPTPPTTRNAQKLRKRTVRLSLIELRERLGWGFFEQTPGCFTVQRPRAKTPLPKLTS